MQNKILIKTIMVISTCLSATSMRAYGLDENSDDKGFTGKVRMRYDYFFVNDDEGRFREDNWRNDDASWGVDYMNLRSTRPGKYGYDWTLEGTAMYSYNYDLHLLLSKEDSHYFKFDFKSLRHYYDGSIEYWDPTQYSAPKSLAEIPDGDLFLDNRDYNIEFGTAADEGAQFVTGWHRYVTDGKKTHLYGGQATEPGLPDFWAIPAVTSQRGITDTIYGELAQTFAEKYNFRVRQEFEQYHDDQLTVFPRSSSGTLTDQRYKDNPGYTNWRTLVMTDSFDEDKEEYITANYMYNYLNNNSTRDAYTTTDFTDNQAGASRKTNSAALGAQKLNIFPNLDITAAVDYEDSNTNAESTGLLNGIPESFDSRKHLARIGESVRLVFKGIERTTLSFDANIEQKYIKWKDNDDGEIWRTDTDHTNQAYAVKLVHRHNRALRSTLIFGMQNLERTYTNHIDSTPDGYPGFLGNYRITGNDVTAKTDWRINSTTSTTLMYQFAQQSIRTELGNKTQNMEINRGSGSISMNPSSNIFLVGTFMLENYQLDTPARGTQTNTIADGSRAFDYVGNSYSLMLDGTYVFDEKTSCTFGFQHTEALGSGDGNNTNDSRYDKISLMLTRKLSESQTFSAGYQFIDFDNRDGGDFDDYDAHGIIFMYEFEF